MLNTARWYSAARKLLVVFMLQGIVAACDATSAVDPGGMRIPDPSFTVVPSGLTAVASSWSQIDLSWPASKSASSYEVSRSTTGATGSYTVLAVTASLSYSDAGLTESTQYCYRIRSRKAAGRNIIFSTYSDPVCATTPAAPIIPAPSGTGAVPQGSWAVRITWADNSPDEQGFFIEQATSVAGPWSTVNTAAANATSLTQAANPEDQRCYRVVAFIGARRSAPSPEVCTAAPVWVSDLTGAGTVDQSINLHWTDNSGVEDGYEVSRYSDGAGWSVVATLGADANSYIDNAVTLDVRYTYRVRATNDGGYGDYSNAVTALAPSAAPAAPLDAQAGFYYDEWSGEYWFYISWTPGSTNAEGFRINVSDGAGGWIHYATADGSWSSWWEYYNYWSPQSGCYQVVAFNAFGESSPVEACVPQ